MIKKTLCFFLVSSCTYFSAQQGNVGINTENPNATLDIVSKSNTITTKALKISNSSAIEMVTVRNNGQVGINQPAPASDALLDLNSDAKSLLLTRVNNPATAVANPVNGMILYDTNQKCVVSYENGSWTGCLSASGSGSSASVVADCTSGFSGTYISGAALSGSYYAVTLSNNSFSNATITIGASDLVLSGVSGLTVSNVSLTAGGTAVTSVNLNSGASQTLYYNITGTPGAVGTLKGKWTKLTLSCTNTKNVTLGDAIFSTSPASYVFSANDSSVPINNAGLLATGTIVNISYTGGRGAYDPYTSPDIAIPAAYCNDGASDWTFAYSYQGGTFSTSGTIPVTLITKKAGVITAWPAFQVTNIATINFNVATNPWILNGNSYSGVNVVLHEGGDVIRGAIALGGNTSGPAYDAAGVNDYVKVTMAEYDKLTAIVPGITNFGMKLADRSLVAGTAEQLPYMFSNNIPTTAIPFAFSTKVAAGSPGCSSLVKQSNSATGLCEVAWNPSNPGISFTAPATNDTYYYVIKRPNIYMPANTNIAVHGFFNGWGQTGGGTGCDGCTSSARTNSSSGQSLNCVLATAAASGAAPLGTPPSNIYLNYDIKWTTTKAW